MQRTIDDHLQGAGSGVLRLASVKEANKIMVGGWCRVRKINHCRQSYYIELLPLAFWTMNHFPSNANLGFAYLPSWYRQGTSLSFVLRRLRLGDKYLSPEKSRIQDLRVVTTTLEIRGQSQSVTLAPRIQKAGAVEYLRHSIAHVRFARPISAIVPAFLARKRPRSHFLK